MIPVRRCAAVAAATLAVSMVGATAAASTSPPTLQQHLYGTYAITAATVSDIQRDLVYSIEPAGLLAVLHINSGRLRTVVVGDAPTSLALDEPNGEVYVTNTRSNTVTVVRGERVLATVRLPRHAAPTGVLVDPRTQLTYVTDTGDGRVSILSGTHLVRSPKVGKLPSGLTELNRTVYVADTGSGRLTLLRGRRVVGMVAVGGTPTAMATASNLGLIYVLDPVLSTVRVIKHAKLAATIALRTGATPTALVVSERTGTVVVLESGLNTPAVSTLSGVAILADTTLVTEAVAENVAPTGLAVDPATGDVVVGTNTGGDGFALHGRHVIATGNVRFSGVALIHRGRFFAGTGNTLGDPGITSDRLAD
jgi:DNA-binding beta-propeller fold protein YncE